MKDKGIFENIYKFNFLMSDTGNIIGNKCHAYFKGMDGLGTCNTACQWWSHDACPMWIPKDKWDTKEDWINQ